MGQTRIRSNAASRAMVPPCSRLGFSGWFSVALWRYRPRRDRCRAGQPWQHYEDEAGDNDAGETEGELGGLRWEMLVEKPGADDDEVEASGNVGYRRHDRGAAALQRRLEHAEPGQIG